MSCRVIVEGRELLKIVPDKTGIAQTRERQADRGGELCLGIGSSADGGDSRLPRGQQIDAGHVYFRSSHLAGRESGFEHLQIRRPTSSLGLPGLGLLLA